MNKTFAALLILCHMQVQAESLTFKPEQIAAFGIETSKVIPVKQTLSKTFPAKITVPNAHLRVIASPLDGVVETLLVAEGENVTKGQALAMIRSSRLLELQATYLKSRTKRLLSAETVMRDRKLRAEGIIAQRRLLESESVHRENTQTEARDNQALQLAGMSNEAVKQLAKTQKMSASLSVTSPLNGVVLKQIATAGQRLTEADPLYHIGDLSKLWVEVHVPLESLGTTKTGTQVKLAKQNLQATVITVGRMIHGTDQGVLVRAEVSSGTDQLRPGQFVKAQLIQNTISDALRVPSSAVVKDGEQNYVFVRDGNDFKRVAVTIIAQEINESIIKAELLPNSAVAIRGTAALKAAWVSGGNE
jgi:RND family efflux transporter MFP subunit